MTDTLFSTQLFPGIPIWSQAIFFAVLMIWSVIWKGLALWRAAKLDSKIWFIALLIVNTVGILEILYLFVFSKREKNTEYSSQNL